MAVTQSQIDELQTMMAEGVLRMRFGDREVYYDSFDKMRERMRYLQDQLNAQNGVKPVRRRTVFLTRKGF